jgi:hypothetical protein
LKVSGLHTRSRGVTVFDNGKSVAVTWKSPPLFRLEIQLMKKPCFIVAVAFCVAACIYCRVSANNNLFLPGDAFFPTEITADSISKLATEKNQHEFVYSSFGGYDGAFCGYAGYNRAKISNLDDAFIANLKSAYEQIRKYEPRLLREEKRDGKIHLHETNGIRVLFYNDSFEFPKFELGLRYNENWVAEAVKFGHQPRSLRLCCLIDDKDAVTHSWRDAGLVDSLDVLLPKIELKPVPETETPITINGKIKAIVFGSTSLSDFFRPSDGISFLIVDENGITEMTYDGFEDYKWKATKK